jgi:hypothetical protein
MDLGLFVRVLWRFKGIVLLGLSLAFALALLAYVKVDFANGMKMTYRETEQWESLSTLFVTDPDFTLGSTADGGGPTDAEAAAAASQRMLSLTALYMQLATSDPVLRVLAEKAPIDGAVQTFPITSTGDGRGDPLPMMTFSAISATPQRAHGLAQRHIDAFLTYLERDQQRRGVEPADRVKVEVLRRPQAPVLLVPRKKTRPIIVFLTVAIATFGLAFILENMRPRVRAISGQGQQNADSVRRKASRRTA